MRKMLLFLALLVLCSALALSACSASPPADPSTDSGQQEQSNDVQDTSGEEIQDTDDDLAYIQDKGELIIGVTQYEPMNYLNENGEWAGFDTEFAQAACHQHEPVFQQLEFRIPVFHRMTPISAN